jgi:queuosine precursor transporter
MAQSSNARANLRVPALVAAYLGAAVAANLGVAAYGAAALPVSAFLLIPFDLCSRDLLHERWEGRRLKARMAALIAAGSLLSFVAQPSAGQVALASALSFAATATADALVYSAARHLGRGARMNLSNACSAALDSLVFPLVAFEATTAALSGSQAGAKFVGGLFWSWVFLAALRRRHYIARG